MLIIIVFSERVNYSLLQLIAKQITDKNGLKQLSIVHILLQLNYLLNSIEQDGLFIS